jgi:putative ABC transport system permease protein
MKKHDLGFTLDQTLVLETFAKFGPPGSDSAFMKSLDAFKSDLLLHPKISGVTASYDIPGKEHLSFFPTFRNIKNSDEMVSLYYSRIDYDFIPMFNVKIVAGRNFSNEIASDKTAVILNREALVALGFDSPDQAVGRDIRFGRGPNPNKVNVIGVVDFRANSFKDKNVPVVYQVNWAPLRFLSLRLTDMTSVNETISELHHQWKRIFPDQPFSYFFLDEFFNQQYRADETLSATLSLLTGLSITIACLGLYGLSSIVMSQRVKEVGIRKILGASVLKLFLMLSKDFALLLLVAAVIAAPVVWYSVSKWLEGYALKAPISGAFYLLSLLAMLVIVLITIGNHTWRIARANPVNSLRND